MITRRSFLRGSAGAMIALPFLPSLARGAGSRPRRFVAFYHPNGVYELAPSHGQPPFWYARGDGASYTMGSSNVVLEALRPHLLWLNGIDMPVAVDGFGEQHQRGLGALLTGAPLEHGNFTGNDGSTDAGYPAAISVDQELINYLGAGTKKASLQLGVHAVAQDVSGAISYGYQEGKLTPNFPNIDPLVVFRDLFYDIATPPGTLEVIRRRRSSVLDQVMAQLGSMQTQLSAAERRQLDAHLTMVRDLEMRVTAIAETSTQPATCSMATEPVPMEPKDVANMNAIAKLQLDLLVLALQCDLTRIGSVMFSDALNHISMPFVGISGDVHNISHGSETSTVRTDLIKRDKWMADQFGYFVQRLLDTPSGDGTLLDDTLVFWGSEVSVGYTHSHVGMPFVFAGHAAGWAMGRSVSYSGQAHNDLLLAIMHSFGGSHSTFGPAEYCTGPLSGLF